MKTKAMLTLSILGLLVAGIAYGQVPSLNAKIPFAFTVGNRTLPAGQYQFKETEDARNISIVGKGVSAYAEVFTRLAASMHTTPKDAHIVFDKAGDTYTLAEVWLPNEDGYVLNVTKGKHEHRVLDVPK